MYEEVFNYNQNVNSIKRKNNTQTVSLYIRILTILAIYTSSFEVALTLNIGGLNFRFSQLAIIMLGLGFFTRVLRGKKILSPYNGLYILICALLNTMFVFNAIYIKNAIAYDLWFIFNIMLVYVFFNIFNTKNNIYFFVKIYINSFIFVCYIGFFQYILYTYLDINFYMDTYDRIHAFCYEPSYFSTYLLPCWCLLAYMIEKKCEFVFSLKKQKIYFFILTVAMLLSWSRMGVLMMFVYLIFRGLMNFKSSLVKRRGSVYINTRTLKFVGLIILVVFFIIIYFMYLYIYNYEKLLNMVNGLGLLGSAAHSSKTRENGLMETLQIFFENPIIGCSLGDLSARIAKLRGIIYRGETGMSISIFAEQFAATGIVGGTLFILYILKLIFLGNKKNILKDCDYSYVNFFKGACIGLAFQVIILNMNQNVLRTYFWVNIAAVSILYNGLKYFKNEEENLVVKENLDNC